MITAAAMPLVIGAAGMAADTIQWTLWKRQLQRAADTGAVAGAYALGQGKTVSSAAIAAIGKDPDVGMNTPTIENAPTSGSFAGNTRAVRVIVSASHHLPFSGMFVTTPTIIAEATAAILQNGNHCVISLEDTSEVGITMTGNATVDLACGMATNSKASNAIDASGSSYIVATPVTAVGGLTNSSNYKSPTELQPYSIPQVDPFASLPNPAPTNCQNKYSVNSNQTGSLTSNFTTGVCYKGMDLKGTVTLGSGIYYIDGNSFSAGAQANITGTNVVIILTSTNPVSDPASIATVDMQGGATVNLTSPTAANSTIYNGVLFYQDRRANSFHNNNIIVNKINGNSSSTFDGGIYFAKQQVEFTGTTDMHTDCVQMVGRRVVFSGNSKIKNKCTNDPNPGFTGYVVRLVA